MAGCAPHIIVDVVDPSVAPEAIGDHYINTATRQEWRSFGTDTVADWVLQVSGILCQTEVTNLVANTPTVLTFNLLSSEICSVEIKDTTGERIHMNYTIIAPNQVSLTSNLDLNNISVTVVGG